MADLETPRDLPSIIDQQIPVIRREILGDELEHLVEIRSSQEDRDELLNALMSRELELVYRESVSEFTTGPLARQKRDALLRVIGREDDRCVGPHNFLAIPVLYFPTAKFRAFSGEDLDCGKRTVADDCIECPTLEIREILNRLQIELKRIAWKDGLLDRDYSPTPTLDASWDMYLMWNVRGIPAQTPTHPPDLSNRLNWEFYKETDRGMMRRLGYGRQLDQIDAYLANLGEKHRDAQPSKALFGVMEGDDLQYLDPDQLLLGTLTAGLGCFLRAVPVIATSKAEKLKDRLDWSFWGAYSVHTEGTDLESNPFYSMFSRLSALDLGDSRWFENFLETFVDSYAQEEKYSGDLLNIERERLDGSCRSLSIVDAEDYSRAKEKMMTELKEDGVLS